MLATVCVGKEAYQALTAKFRGRKRPVGSTAVQ